MVSTGPSLRSRQRYPTSLQAATMDSAAIAAATSLRTRERIAMMRGGMGGSIRNLDASFTNHQDAHDPVILQEATSCLERRFCALTSWHSATFPLPFPDQIRCGDRLFPPDGDKWREMWAEGPVGCDRV